MYVRIDEARKYCCIAEVMKFVAIGYLIRRNDSPDPLSFDKDSARANSFGSHHAASDERLQLQNVSSSVAISCGENSILRNSASGLYSLLSQAAAKESMSTDFAGSRVAGAGDPLTIAHR